MPENLDYMTESQAAAYFLAACRLKRIELGIDPDTKASRDDWNVPPPEDDPILKAAGVEVSG